MSLLRAGCRLGGVIAILAAAPLAPAQDVFRAGEVLPGAVLQAMALDRATEDQILALAPERIVDREVREVLTRAPAPRIVNLHGSVPLVTMAPFAEFLVAMGYPEERVGNPRDGRRSYSSFTDSRQLAGSLAWHYEREGMMPMLIGHSQGGMLAIRVLHELAGGFGGEIPVWNPLIDESEARFAVIDPLTGDKRPVVGLQVPYATALATGKVMRVLLGQRDMLAKLRRIPDSVGEFTGFFIEWDLLAGTFGEDTPADPYRATGSAVVRNVMLPAAYWHITLPLTSHLAANELTRAWIDAYTPDGKPVDLPAGAGVDASNILHAADIWYSVKKHWCIEAQRLIRARRRLAGAGG